MFVHDGLQVGGSRQHSLNLTIQRQSSYGFGSGGLIIVNLVNLNRQLRGFGPQKIIK